MGKARLAEVIQGVLKDPGDSVGGRYLQVLLLTAPDDPKQTLHLPQPVSDRTSAAQLDDSELSRL
jgi:hypothetical protein